MSQEQQINNAFDYLSIVLTNSIVYFTANFATPLISFTTATLSLYYIIRKIRKEFFTEQKEEK